ncbi:hypothetical protein Tco_1409301 [Tanacetum coccineum]
MKLLYKLLLKNAFEEEDKDEELIVVPYRELDELAQKHSREVPKNKATSTTSVNSGSGPKRIFDEASYDDEGMVHDFNNLPTEVAVSPIPTLRIHNIHPQSQILGDPKSSVQTRSRMQQHLGAHALEEPKKISEALKDDSWVEAMQEELLQFRLQQVWILVDLPLGAKEEGIDYDEVFAPVARIEAIRGFRGVPRPLLPVMLPVVAVDQSAGQADQAVTQPSPSKPLPSSSPPLVISATTESGPTPIAEPTTHPNSLSPEPDNEPLRQKLVDIEQVAVSSSLRLLEPKRTIESRAKRSSINLVRTQHPSETMVFHNEDGNPARANIKQALGYLKDGDGDGNSQHLRYQVNNRMLRHDLHLL